MAEWTFVLDDETGTPVDEGALTDARERKLTWTRRRPAAVEFALDLDDPAAAAVNRILENGIPRLRAYRDGDPENAPSFHGFWEPMREDAEAQGESDAMRLVFRSPLARYERLFTPPLYVVTAKAEWTITSQLLNLHDDNETGIPHHGLVMADPPDVGVLRDRTYESKQIAEAIQQLAEVQGAGEFREEFVYGEPYESWVLAQIRWAPSFGEDRTASAIFEFGDDTLRNVQSVGRQTFPPVNFVRVLGEDGQYAEAEDLPSVEKYGRWGKVVQATEGTVDAATLQAKADAELRPEPIRVVEFEPDPEGPQPWRDWWLGDTVRFAARRGALAHEEDVVPNSLSIEVDDEGQESKFTLTFEGGVTE